MFTFDRLQVANGLTVLGVVRSWQAAGHWGPRYSRLVGRACIQCCLDESNLYNDANPNVPGSMDYPHDAHHEGTDHASVGLFQQQVPLWGPVSRCQNPVRATEHFLSALLPIFPGNVALQIQRVQGSFDPTGSNYHAQLDRAQDFMAQYWAASKRPGSRRHTRALTRAPLAQSELDAGLSR